MMFLNISVTYEFNMEEREIVQEKNVMKHT